MNCHSICETLIYESSVNVVYLGARTHLRGQNQSIMWKFECEISDSENRIIEKLHTVVVEKLYGCLTSCIIPLEF